MNYVINRLRIVYELVDAAIMNEFYDSFGTEWIDYRQIWRILNDSFMFKETIKSQRAIVTTVILRKHIQRTEETAIVLIIVGSAGAVSQLRNI